MDKRKSKKLKKAKKAAKSARKILRGKKPKTANRKPKKRAEKKKMESGFSAESLFKAKIKVIGIGGGGGSIVSEIGRSLEKATFVVADTDIRALKKKAGIKYFWFGENLTRGLGTGANTGLAEQAANESRDKISKLFENQDIIIFVASLGAGVGSGATKVFAEVAKDFGGITLGIFTLPFKFEGKNKSRTALKSLKCLRNSLNVSVTIPNERIFKIIDGNTPITQAFSTVNRNLIESLESLIDIIYSPGLINIDFADLRAILKGRGNLAFLNTVEGAGKDRAEETVGKIFQNPLYQNSNFTAENILFNIAGGQSLSMFEVEKISRDIAELNPSAKIIFGISKNAKLKNKIKTTLLMTGPGIKIKKTEIKPEVKPAAAENEIKLPAKKPKKKLKNPKASGAGKKRGVSIPIFNRIEERETSMAGSGKLSIIHDPADSGKRAIRRNALEIKKAQEIEEQKKEEQEKEWEIPAFLRRVKFKS